MAYTPTTWATGDVITQEKLNNIEQGIVQAVLGVGWNDDGSGLNKTWQEIRDAAAGGSVVVLNGANPMNDNVTYGILMSATSTNSVYRVQFLFGGSTSSFSCSSADDYPISA